MGKFIGQTGLVYSWSKLKAWVAGFVKITEVDGVKTLTVGNITVTLATKTSQLTNDAGFITASDVPEGAAPSSTTPKMDGTAAVGTETAFARGDHRHPTDTSRQAVINDLDAIRSGAGAGATAYQKPAGGIPKSDLAEAVKTSLGKADTALQSYTETDPVFAASVAHGITSGDISNWNGKQAAIEDLDNIRSGAAAGATALQSFTETDPTVPAWAKASSKPTYSKSEVGLGNVTDDAQVKRSEMGVANGVATLGSDGKVPSSQLPSYVDDVVEAYIRSGQTALSSTWLATGSATGTVITPESGVIYMIMNGNDTYPTNSEYRWGGTAYVPIYDGGATEMTTAEMDALTNNWT